MDTPSRDERIGLAVIGLLSGLGVVLGWNTFWFLCDDAYIAFRYVSNSVAGWGYTWNPPPFQPVEGYTSFLWVVLLDVVWRVTGWMPPQTANVLSLGAALLTIPVVMRLAWFAVPWQLQRQRIPLVALVMLATVTNRTWLAWTSSGLETALFTLMVLGWTAVGLTRPLDARTVTGLSLMAALIELTRPDGLLFWGFTGLIAGWWWLTNGRRPRQLLALWPLLGPVLHVAWRLRTYGEPLPNTYSAKQVAAWPEAGLNYLTSFTLEYAYFVWVAVALTALATSLWRRAVDLSGLDVSRGLVIAALLGQFGYYTLRVGGDHFEYRVYTHLVPLVAMTLPWLWVRVAWRPRLAAPLLGLMIALGSIIPWTHWSLSKDRLTRAETKMMRVEVTPHLPAVLSPWTQRWDDTQDWLIDRWVGMRHQEHAVYGQHQRDRYPSREQGSQFELEDYHAYVRGGVGYPGWILPEVIILDQYGLNDWVVARNPKPPGKKRRMAHDRRPPPGYHACFDPNMRLIGNATMLTRPRKITVDAERVAECEATFRAKIEKQLAEAGRPKKKKRRKKKRKKANERR